MHYPKLEKDEYDSGKSKAHFQKGKINYSQVLKTYKEIKESLEKEKEKNDSKYTFNINIYNICYPDGFSPNSQNNSEKFRENQKMKVAKKIHLVSSIKKMKTTTQNQWIWMKKMIVLLFLIFLHYLKELK